jgi:phage terminase large subunit
MEQELALASDKPRTIGELVVNRRAQYYLYLRDRVQRTYLAIVKGVYTDPEQMISFSSEIEELDVLRSEICSVPKKDNLSGKFQVMSKVEMRKQDIASPDGADAVMMSLSGVDALRRKNAPMRVHEGSIIDSAVGY